MNLEHIINAFSLSGSEERVFEKLTYKTSVSVTQLARETNLSRTSMYDILKSLIDKGLVREESKGSKKTFSLESIKKIQEKLNEKVESLNKAEETLVQLSSVKKEGDYIPDLKIYRGQKELQTMMNDMLLYENSHVFSYWPIEDVEELLTTKFFKEFHKKRASRKIAVEMILPYNSSKIIKKITAKDFLKDIDIRIAPKGIDFSLGYTIYPNTVRFISSKKENFGFLINSHELSETMRGQFKIIWNLSTKV